MMMKIAATTMKVGIRLPFQRGQGLPAANQLRVQDQEPQAESFKNDDEAG